MIESNYDASSHKSRGSFWITNHARIVRNLISLTKKNESTFTVNYTIFYYCIIFITDIFWPVYLYFKLSELRVYVIF